MPSLNFSVFVDKVESKEKRCTIRAKRKIPIEVGQHIHLFTGMRTRSCRKLGLEVCLRTTPIVIEGNRVYLGDQDLSAEEISDLARDDGFNGCADFFAYFNSQSPRFEGDWIQW